MNHSDTGIKLKSRSEEILECRRQLDYWTKRLQELQAELRRQYLLASVEFCPKLVHRQLSSEEKKDREFVYKILSSGGDVFGENPWDEKDTLLRRRFPEELLSDPDAVIAFVSSDNFRNWGPSRSYSCLSSESIRDCKKVMMAVCSCSPDTETLRMASPRLRDDEDIVRAALLEDKYILRFDTDALEEFQYASVRLRGNVKLICDLIAAGGSGYTSWLRHAALSDLDNSELHQIVSTVLDTPSREVKQSISMEFLQYFPPVFRDNREVMLEFVKRNWRSLRWCGEHMRCDADVIQAAVSWSPDAYQYALGQVRQAYEENRTVNSVIEELENGLSFCNVPDEMKSNREVILSGLKAGQNTKYPGIGLEELPDDLLGDKKFVLSYIEAHGMFDQADCEDLSEDLPDVLQRDEEIGLAFLRTGYYYYEDILEDIPSLWSSREAMMGTTKIEREGPEDIGLKYDHDFIRKCTFLDDEEFMLAACKNDQDNLEYASERLVSDYDFMLAVSNLSSTTGLFIKHAAPEFQVNNPNLVVKAIELRKDCTYDEQDSLFASLDPDVWHHRPVVLAWLKEGWSLFDRLEEVFDDDFLPFCDDPEVIRLSTRTCPDDIKWAHPSLLENRKFLLSLVKENWKCSEHFLVGMKQDDEILTAAVAISGGALCSCFGLRWVDRQLNDDNDTDYIFNFLVQFTGRVRSKLQCRDSFVQDFLRGISICDQSHIPPAKRCWLPRLNRGAETSTAWKRLIAEYAGVPLGAQVKELRAAAANLDAFGF